MSENNQTKPQVGVVVVAHSNIAQEFLKVVEAILQKPLVQMTPLSIFYNQDPEEIATTMQQAVKKVDQGRGVLILTDMFGGTPSNVSLSFLEEGKVEVISGFNLPMLLKIAVKREGKSLLEAAEYIRKYGSDNIHVASRLLAQRK